MIATPSKQLAKELGAKFTERSKVMIDFQLIDPKSPVSVYNPNASKAKPASKEYPGISSNSIPSDIVISKSDNKNQPKEPIDENVANEVHKLFKPTSFLEI